MIYLPLEMLLLRKRFDITKLVVPQMLNLKRFSDSASAKQRTESGIERSVSCKGSFIYLFCYVLSFLFAVLFRFGYKLFFNFDGLKLLAIYEKQNDWQCLNSIISLFYLRV